MTNIVYSIVTTPDPLNPNEQCPGNTITDDRLYGYDIIAVLFSSCSYNSEYFTKTILSNTITIPSIEWVIGNKITLQIEKSCNCA